MLGPRTVEIFKNALAGMDVVVWNGPLGLFEREAFAGGTRALVRALAASSARTIACGGETVQAVINSRPRGAIHAPQHGWRRRAGLAGSPRTPRHRRVAGRGLRPVRTGMPWTSISPAA